ncbi:MAG: hypothetical protein GX753_05065 [Erysipelothrix sp.]|nr:hypothetical protein [Erysipelothrix sp.]
MKRFLALVRINLKTAGDDFTSNLNLKKQVSPLKKIGQRILILVLALYIFAIISIPSYYIVEQFININQPTLLIYLVFTIVPVVTLYFSILSTPNIFYFSKDIINYLSLPFKSIEIIGAKFITAYVYSLLSTLFFIAPILVIYFVKVGPSILFILYTLLGVLLTPIVPLSLALVIVVILMRFMPFLKNKDLFMYLTFGLVFIPVFIISFAGGMTSTNEVAIQEFIQSLANMDNNAFRNISLFFPTSRMLASGIIDQNAIALVLNTIMTLAIAVVALVLIQSFYFEGVVSVSEVSSKKKKLNLNQQDREIKKQPLVLSFLKQDLKTIIRTPAFVLNYFSPLVIFPIIILIPMFLEGGLATLGELTSEISLGYHTLYTLLSTSEKLLYPLILGFVIALFFGNMEASSNTAISREANNLKSYITYPILLSDIVKSKALLSMIMGSIIPILMLIFATIILKPNLMTILLFVMGAISGLILIVFAGLYVDVRSPSLNWETEQQAVKGNFKQTIVILPFMFIPFVFVVLALSMNATIFLIIFVIAIPLLNYLMVRLTLKTADTKLVKTIQNMNH